MRGHYQVVPHDTHVVFTTKTVFNKLTNYNRLYPQLNKTNILTSNKYVHMYIYLCVTMDWYMFYETFCPHLIIQNIRILVRFTAPTKNCSFYELESQAICSVDNIILNNTGAILFFVDLETPELNSYKSVQQKLKFSRLEKRSQLKSWAIWIRIYIRYKVFLVLEYETNEISALIVGKSGENVFGVACKDLAFNQ
ncbi:unnamed protein product [Malus baccata var. baccata]